MSKQVTHRKKCPKCNSEEYYWTGVTLTSYPAQYTPICKQCHQVDTYYQAYPYTEIIYDEEVEVWD